MSTERKSDKELADQLDAQDRLTNRGYTRESCKSCDGIGFKATPRHVGFCVSCNGRGFHWQAPITK